MRFIHRLVIVIYVIRIGWFAFLFLPSLLGTAGPPPMPVGCYILTLIECQIPATIIVALLYLLTWLVRVSLRPRPRRGFR